MNEIKAALWIHFVNKETCTFTTLKWHVKYLKMPLKTKGTVISDTICINI